MGKDNKREKIKRLLAKGYSQAEIARRLKISRQRVNALKKKIETKVKKIGGVDNPRRGGLTKVDKSKKSEWRFHSHHFVVKPYYRMDKYKRMIREKGNYRVALGEWRYYFHKETIEIRQVKDICHTSKLRALELLEASFNRTLTRAGQRYGFRVFKEGLSNIRLVRRHIGITPSDVSKANKDYLAIRSEDGRIWFMLDRSKGYEHEYTHYDTALDNSDIIEPLLNNYRTGKAWDPIVVQRIIFEIVTMQRDFYEGFNKVIKAANKLLPKPEKAENGEKNPRYIG